jgi:hypothetical protein
MPEIKTYRLIEAPPRVVWDCFMDKSRWRSFSDFVDLSPGTPIAAGRSFWFGLRLLGLPPVPLKVQVLRCDPEEVRWVGGIPAFPLFRGEHYFRFVAAGEGKTRFVQNEDFSGPLAEAFMALLGEATRTAYHRFNDGLARLLKDA